MTQDKWVWMPHAGHFICGNECRFHLATYVGKYIVSTVGEYFPDAPVREILAETRKIVLEGIGDARRRSYLNKIGFEQIGCDRTYETMVFRAQKSDHKCCPWTLADPSDLDMLGYNDSDEAYQGHMKLCRKWAKK